MVVEIEQAIDEKELALDQRGSELEEYSKRVEGLGEEMETHSGQLGGLFGTWFEFISSLICRLSCVG